MAGGWIKSLPTQADVMILHDEYTKQCREETATDRGQAIRKKRDVRFTM